MVRLILLIMTVVYTTINVGAWTKSPPQMNVGDRVISYPNLSTFREDLGVARTIGRESLKEFGTLNCVEGAMTLAASKLNMTQSGWYLISVETASGVTTKKVCVK